MVRTIVSSTDGVDSRPLVDAELVGFGASGRFGCIPPSKLTPNDWRTRGIARDWLNPSFNGICWLRLAMRSDTVIQTLLTRQAEPCFQTDQKGQG